MTYYIRMKDNTTEPVDKACPFIYEGFELFTWWNPELKEFQVVESTTGLLLIGETTEEEAIIKAKEQLNKAGLDRAKNRIIELQKQFNIKIDETTMNVEIL